MSVSYRYGTKRYMIAELANDGKSKREAFNELRPLVEAQIKPMVFSANIGGARAPKALSEQLIELKNEIGRVYALLGRSTSSDFESEEIEIEDSAEESEEEISPAEDEEDGEDEEEEKAKPVAAGKKRVKDELARFLIRVREIRKFCADRAEVSETVDSISMRPAQAASRLIPAGIPVEALLCSMAMHWPTDVRRDAGITDFDYAGFSRQVMNDRGIPAGEFHELFGYALLLAEERQPIMFVGPAGSGKSHVAKQLAGYLELPYGETPMSPGATRGDLLGRHTIGGFITSEFCELYSGGGVFNFEEIDASDPSMLIVLNNALAQSELYNSSNGEKYDRHTDFIAVSTANTFGLGANRDYTARERLDAATIDRWRMGRIFVPIDEKVETEILYAKQS